MSGSLSIFHWLIILGVLFVYVWPMAIILRRLGYSRWLVLLWFVPIVNAIGLWVIARAKWPNERLP